MAVSVPPSIEATPPLTPLTDCAHRRRVVPMIATGVTPVGIVVVSATPVSGVAFGFVSVTLTVVGPPCSTACGERETVAVGAEIATAEFACVMTMTSNPATRTPRPCEAIFADSFPDG